jgi:hypothetical protein
MRGFWQHADAICRSTRLIEARVAELEAILQDNPYHETARLELSRHVAHLGQPSAGARSP